jgi:hypothetical protein
MSEQCGHGTCEYDGRLEYCTTLAAEPDGTAVVIGELLDALLVDADQPTLRARGSTWKREGAESTMERRISFLERPEDGELGDYVSETVLDILYERHRGHYRESYMLAISWLVAGNAEVVPLQPFTVNYTIELYEYGPIHAFIAEPLVLELDSGLSEERRMTEYDYEQLGMVLMTAYGAEAPTSQA